MDLEKYTDLLSKDYCPDCAQYAVRVRNKDEARRYVARRVREGEFSTAFRLLAADLIDPDVKIPRGRPKGSPIDDYFAGDRFRLLRSATQGCQF